MTRTLTLLAGLTVIAASGAAHAEAISLRPYPVAARVAAMSLTQDAAAFQISKSDTTVPVRYAHAPVQLPRGIARTSVESRLAGDGPVASAGVLCGLKPSADYSGMGTARGYDNDGRFVGAKLAFTF